MWTNILDFNDIKNINVATFSGVFQNENFTQNKKKNNISKLKKDRVSAFTEKFIIFLWFVMIFDYLKNHEILGNSNLIFMHNMDESIISTCKC